MSIRRTCFALLLGATASSHLAARMAAAQEAYLAHVGSDRSIEQAQKTLEELRNRLPTVVSNAEGFVTPIDLGQRGVWYRLHLGPAMAFTDASALCEALRRSGHGYCKAVIADRSAQRLTSRPAGGARTGGHAPFGQLAASPASPLQLARRLFYVARDYRGAAASITRFLETPGLVEQDRDKLFALYNASNYAIGAHEEGLSAICREIQRGRRKAIAFLFDVHAHARKIALERGYSAAARVLGQHRRDCRSDVFSDVWTAIPLAKMEYLRRGIHVMDEGYVLPAKDKIILKRIAQQSTQDAYIEYAWYFLHAFDRVSRPELIALRRSSGGSDEADGMITASLGGTDVRTGISKVANASVDQLVAMLTSGEAGSGNVYALREMVAGLRAHGRFRDIITLYERLPARLKEAVDSPASGALRSEFMEALYLENQLRSAPAIARAAVLRSFSTASCGRIENCRALAQWVPNSITTRSLLVDAVNSSMRAELQSIPGDATELEDYGRLFFEYASQSHSVEMRQASAELRYVLSRLARISPEEKRTMLGIYVASKCQTTADCVRFLNAFPESKRSVAIAEDRLVSLAYDHELQPIFEFLNRVPRAIWERARQGQTDNAALVRHSSLARDLLASEDDKALLNHAIAIKGRLLKGEKGQESRKESDRFPNLATAIFATVARRMAGRPTGELAHFLWFTTARYRTSSDAPLKIIDDFIRRYPRGGFIDDAMTEKGLLLAERSGKEVEAIQIWHSVYEQMPNSNAADNALYHIAELERRHGNYLRAAYYYGRIGMMVTARRLGKLAKVEAPRLRLAHAALNERKAIAGLRVSAGWTGATIIVDDASQALSHVALKEGDVLTAINGETINSPDGDYNFDGAAALYATLSPLPVGSWHSATFERTTWPDNAGEPTVERFEAQVRIGQTTIFDVRFVDYGKSLPVHSEPHDGGAMVGSLKASAQCVKYDGASQGGSATAHAWHRVRWSEQGGATIQGWVNARFLRESSSGNCR